MSPGVQGVKLIEHLKYQQKTTDFVRKYHILTGYMHLYQISGDFFTKFGRANDKILTEIELM